MLNKKQIAGAILGAFLMVNAGAGIEQAYAATPNTAPHYITAEHRTELAHRDDRHRPPQDVKRPHDRAPHRVDRPAPPHRDRHDKHPAPPPRDDHDSHDSTDILIGGILGGIIGSILVSGQ